MATPSQPEVAKPPIQITEPQSTRPQEVTPQKTETPARVVEQQRQVEAPVQQPTIRNESEKPQITKQNQEPATKRLDEGLSMDAIRLRLIEQKHQDAISATKDLRPQIVEPKSFKEVPLQKEIPAQGEKAAVKEIKPQVIDPKTVKETPTNQIEKIRQSTQDSTNQADARRVVETLTTKQVTESQVAKNSTEVAKTLSKAEIVQVVKEAIKAAVKDGDLTKVAEVIKAAVVDPKVREAVRTVLQGSSGGEGSGQPIRAELSKIVATDSTKVRLPVELAKSIDAITQPVTSKQEAMQVLLGLVADASKLQNPVVQAVQAETAGKLQAIQSTIDELLKIRIEQFVALSTKAHGVDGATLQTICNEALQELATRYGLTDEQRALLGRIMVQISDTDFGQEKTDPKQSKEPLDPDKQHKKDLLEPEAKVLSKQELEKLFNEEIAELEEFLKERDEVKLKRAKEKLEALLHDVAEEGTQYVIDNDYEVIKTYTIEGIVVDEETGSAMANVHIYGGLLGALTTDRFGAFSYINVPQDTAYMIGADKLGSQFTPEFFAGTLTMSVKLRFTCRTLN